MRRRAAISFIIFLITCIVGYVLLAFVEDVLGALLIATILIFALLCIIIFLLLQIKSDVKKSK